MHRFCTTAIYGVCFKMPRKIFLRAQNETYYGYIGKRQVRLSKNEREAERMYEKLREAGQPIGFDHPARQLYREFLQWCQQHQSQTTYEWYKLHIESFCDSIGNLRISQLKPHHVEDWVHARFKPKKSGEPCSPNTIIAGIRACIRPMNWAVKRGTLERNPLRGVNRPRPRSRECYVCPEQYMQVEAAVSGRPEFKDLLIVLHDTGARPDEIRRAEARHIDHAHRLIVFPENESKGKLDKRTIRLSPRAYEIVKRLTESTPDGPLFRTRKGNQWRREALAHEFKKLSNKLGFPITAYALRHTFITNALERRVDPLIVANLVGHRDTKMIYRVYGHLNLKQEFMADELNRALGIV